jgi:hypothetical protein
MEINIANRHLSPPVPQTKLGTLVQILALKPMQDKNDGRRENVPCENDNSACDVVKYVSSHLPRVYAT